MAKAKGKEIKTLTLPDTSEIKTMAEATLHAAQELTVGDRPEYELAGEFLLMLKKREEAINKTFDPVVKAAYNAHQTALAAKAEHMLPVREAAKVVKGKMGEFQLIEEKRLKEEENKLREAARKEEEESRARQAEELLAAGRPEDVLTLLGEPVETPPVVLPEQSAPRVKGIVTRTVWKFEVVDEKKIPCEYHQVDLTKIRKIVRATNGEIEIPGIRVYQEKEIAAGGRK